ncbi:nuclear transport factor 2 family protein [Nocardia bovistercoris]|uniref:Nuclear transport factor 2 family protein n=1 Tax=Nocardia bovistercoris TaxID=2785916 RepID=A0A931I647_9NOCA|nr:nuclear transport factor 2 family protein [Nocardia bovistercoris]MBH0775284.1 nuclear transport factor 2 family protein [Nocardia bovistercoris]
MDTAAVHNLMSRYGRLIDLRRAEEWSELFVPEGSLQIGNDSPIVGRAALASFAEGTPAGTHITSIPELRVEADRIIASTGWLFVSRSEGRSPSGFYHDEIRPSDSDGKVLFISRRIEILPQGS